MNLWSLRRLGRFGPARRLVKRLFSFYFRTGVVRTVRFGPLKGMKWQCHEAQQFWMPLGTYETETTRWLQQKLASGMTFFDIGANAGYFALVGSTRVGATGQVVAFEPSPLFAAMVQRNVELNHLRNVCLSRSAVSNSNGTTRFVLESVGANSHLADTPLQHAKSAPEEEIEVNVTTLDSYVSENGVSPDVIKIDVEGAELMVLEGARDTLSKHRPHVIVACHSGDLYADCAECLEELNYRISSLEGFEHELIGAPL